MKLKEMLTRGRKLERCDQCGDKEGILEYLLPYGKGVSSGNYDGRYRDLCPACRRVIEAHPLPYVTKTTDLRKSEFRRHEQVPSVE